MHAQRIPEPEDGKTRGVTATGILSCRFGPLSVEYDQRVLRPRPWTLLQSSWAAELATEAAPGPLLELCAGVGHIGLAAAVLADRDLVQVEADPVAAGFAVANAARAGWGGRVDVRAERLEAALRPAERFGVILADPPYLRSADVARWPDDPVTAIDGGPDGLELVVACLVAAAAHLSDDGAVVLQVAGPAQDEQVSDLAAARPELGLRRVAARVVDDARAVVLLRRVTGSATT
jgi:methylase of polypeptide subunit release factors